jgi:ABC-type multidrug transport system ATPase subunit/pSer/pThr/pTyr-binding forkhead associated (FHA) protein
MPTAESPDTRLATITFLTGPLAGQTFTITKPETSIGRDPTNDIVVKEDQRVSRHHARLRLENGVWRVENLSLQNTLRVDQEAIRQAVIQDNSVIGLGQVSTFIFHTQTAEAVPVDELHTAILQPPSKSPAADIPTPQSPVFASTDPEPVTAPVSSEPPDTNLPSAADPLYIPTSVVPRYSRTMIASVLTLGVSTLEVSSNTGEQRKSYPLDKPIINIGRGPANDIVIDDPSVSVHHLQILHEGNQYILIHPHPERPKTTNGLLYQGRKIRGDESFRKVLAQGDVFRIGDERGTLVSLNYQDGSGIHQEPLPPIRPIKLDAPEISIGRHADNTVVLAHPQVSAYHAKLVREGGAYRILDLHSTNHVYVNAQLVTTHLLKLGDELRIGPFRLIYETTQLVQYDESKTIRLDALHLTKVVKKQTLLNDISLSIPPRAFVALVGASGAGKSTLLDALNGLRPVEQGSVLYNGQDYYRNLASFNTQIGYVPQEDIVHRDLTVERALFYAARLRLPGDFTTDQIKQRIGDVLEDVELTEQRLQPVKQLSGGQRKRVSLALELLANPSIFFLDEPTSGLDPGLDRKMMVLLRKLADKGHTIVLVTHATNNINVCDYICFLAKGGRLAYFGPPEEAKTYFGKTDFAEIYGALEATSESPDEPEEAEKRFRVSQEYHTYIEEPLKHVDSLVMKRAKPQQLKQTRHGNPWKQLLILTTRYLELLKNDPINLSILLLQAPVIALLLMWFTDRNLFISTNGVDAATRSPLFLMVVAAIWFGIINSVREIVKEAPIYRRERAMHLGVIPYVLSKVLVLGVLCLIQSLVLLVVIGWKGGYPSHGITWPPFLELYISLTLTALAGLMVGLTLSAVAPNADRAISLVPLIMLPEIIFSGTMFQLGGILGTIADIMATRWGLAALGGTFHLKYFTYCAPLPPGVSPIGIAHGDCPIGFTEGIPDQATFGGFYPVDGEHLLLAWLALVILIFIPFALTIYFQKRKDAHPSS